MGVQIFAKGLIEVEGIKVLVEVKAVRTMRLRYSLRQRIGVVSAPPGVDTAQIADFVRTNLAWLQKQTQRASQSSIVRALPPRAELERFAAATAARVDARAAEMGVPRPALYLRRLTASWGVCCKARCRITINLALVHEPAECLDYVVVHELAHLVHANHSAKFWALVEKHCPDFRRLRAMLSN